MPELPEVEVLVRHLAPLLLKRTIRAVRVHRSRVLRPTTERHFKQSLLGAKFVALSRRGKYLRFELRVPKRADPVVLLGHLGMTGRMYLLPARAELPRHAAVVLNLGRANFVFEDMRYFGRLTLDVGALENLGPEPLEAKFTVPYFADALRRSGQAIKIKLLDQSLLAGVGNIYASEALFRARISPVLPAWSLTPRQVQSLRRAIRQVLREAIERGSTLPLDYAGAGIGDGLFYFGRASGPEDFYQERLRVYDRMGQSCFRCGTPIERSVQAARSTFYCPKCQSC